MAMAALSPNSIMATPIQVNPQVKSDIQGSLPQAAQDSQKTVKAVQTDTITISAQALKMADDKNVAAEKAAKKADEQRILQSARDKDDAAKNETQRNAVKAYASAAAKK